MHQNTPAGWYPDSQFSGQQRYWNGSQWTEHVAPLAPTGSVLTAQQHPAGAPVPQPLPGVGQVPNQQNWFLRHKVMSAVLAVIVLVVIGSSLSSGGDEPGGSAETASASSANDNGAAANADSSSKKAAKKAKPAKPAMTAGQANALGAAKDYLSLTAFSHKGLVRQLVTGDHYNRSNAIYAVNHVRANWKEQAAKSAQKYLDLTHFSHAGLVQQLVVGDGFTHEQAEYGVSKAGL